MKTFRFFLPVLFLLFGITIENSVWAISSSEALPGDENEPQDGSPDRTSEPSSPPSLSGKVTLREVLAATLSGSPHLGAYSWELRSGDARLLQAGLRPNPELSINPENFIGSGAFKNQIQYQNTVQLSQLIELGGKRQLRKDAASAVLERKKVEYESIRIEVLGNATLDFINLVGSQEQVRIARLAVTQAEELFKAVEKRTAASIGTPLEIKRAKILLARAKNSLNQESRNLQAARHKLAANWGSRDAEGITASGEIFTTHQLPTLEALFDGIESAPERRAAFAEAKVRAAEAALARSARVTDVTVSGAWRQGRDWDDQAVVAGVSFPLKVFDRSQGEIAAADAQIQKSKWESVAVELRLRTVVYALYQEIVQAKEHTDALAREILPRIEEAMSHARSGFDQGVYTQLELLDAQKTLIEARREHIQAGTKYHRLIAEVEKILGVSL